jgi:hypothetical protein
MSDKDTPSMRGRAARDPAHRAGLITKLQPCPVPGCGKDPHILRGVTRDGKEPYANIFCRHCWRPGEKSCRGILALDSTQEGAASKWNRLVSEALESAMPTGTA